MMPDTKLSGGQFPMTGSSFRALLATSIEFRHMLRLRARAMSGQPLLNYHRGHARHVQLRYYSG
jgi:hypothetical protein